MSNNKKNTSARERRVLTEFINIYRCQPCLWMIKSQEYRDRNLKDAAYARLSAKLREIDPDADRESVVKKINCLRTNYRKENRKIAEQADKTNYKPRLWYYHLFDFLEGHELPGPNPFDTNDSTDSFDDYDEYQADPLNEIYNEIDEFEEVQQQEQQHYEEEDRQEIKPTVENMRKSLDSRVGSITKQPVSVQQPKTTSMPRKRLRDINDSSDEHDYSSIQVKQSSEKMFLQTEDRYDIFGRMIAMKLRSLSNKKQRLLAEKAINDALFMAEIGELTLDRLIASLNFSQMQTDEEFIRSPTYMPASGTNGGNII